MRQLQQMFMRWKEIVGGSKECYYEAGLCERELAERRKGGRRFQVEMYCQKAFQSFQDEVSGE